MGVTMFHGYPLPARIPRNYLRDEERLAVMLSSGRRRRYPSTLRETPCKDDISLR